MLVVGVVLELHFGRARRRVSILVAATAEVLNVDLALEKPGHYIRIGTGEFGTVTSQPFTAQARGRAAAG